MPLPLLLASVGCYTLESGEYRLELDEVTSSCAEDEVPEPAVPSDLGVDVIPNGELIRLGVTGGTNCPLDVWEFECPDVGGDVAVDYAAEWGADAVVTVDVSLFGRFTDTDRMELIGDIASTCEGTACESLGDASIPFCATTWTWSGGIE